MQPEVNLKQTLIITLIFSTITSFFFEKFSADANLFNKLDRSDPEITELPQCLKLGVCSNELTKLPIHQKIKSN